MRPDHGSYATIPAWARATLEKHAKDERPNRYGIELLLEARTFDPIWNAAQGLFLDLVVLEAVLPRLDAGIGRHAGQFLIDGGRGEAPVHHVFREELVTLVAGNIHLLRQPPADGDARLGGRQPRPQRGCGLAQIVGRAAKRLGIDKFEYRRGYKFSDLRDLVDPAGDHAGSLPIRRAPSAFRCI